MRLPLTSVGVAHYLSASLPSSRSQITMQPAYMAPRAPAAGPGQGGQGRDTAAAGADNRGLPSALRRKAVAPGCSARHQALGPRRPK